MWESSAPTAVENKYNVLTTHDELHEPLVNYHGNSANYNGAFSDREQGFLTCRSIMNHFSDHTSSDDEVEDTDEQGRLTPKISRKKGPHSLVMQLNIDNIHLAANAPTVSRRKTNQ